ncbi:Uu.00g140530.m01.CDS01 [Anthostomella pinea]|uniref:Uu.00g140530.m01.CDS01 n=1 Tax=Anthostomella pinea TaxID=933095 RepID=A0AAI8VRA5_9PEZI|nr:Uu.00g140530.m01.CDS01 [Anthostomella pinea]
MDIGREEKALAFNQADTRFHKLGKRRRAAQEAGQQAPEQPGPLIDPNLFAKEIRDNGNTMMEAIAAKISVLPAQIREETRTGDKLKSSGEARPFNGIR